MQQELLNLFRAAESADAHSSDELFTALYAELHRLAERQLRRGGSEVSLSATTLLHEAYLDIVGREAVDFPDRARFIGYTARAMRGIVIDHVRRAGARKRGGGAVEITFGDDVAFGADSESPVTFESLSEALDDLAALEPDLAQLVDLHFFCGFGLGEIAALRGVSERTVQRNWRKARLLLHASMQSEGAR